MKATLSGTFALLLAAVAASSSFAQCPSCSSQRMQYMPSQYSYGPMPSSYSYAPPFSGMPYGGGYGYMPPQPYGGMQPPADLYGHCSQCCDGQKIMAFPVHRYARSPRDYFMLDIDCCGTH
jgi:hypothetical protein